LPIEECRRLGSLKDEALNEAKERLAWEVTKLIHGEQEANKALAAARAAFRGEGDASQLPSIELPYSRIKQGIDILDLFVESELAPSRSEARRLVQQGGASINNVRVEDEKNNCNTRRFQRQLPYASSWEKASRTNSCKALIDS